MKKVKRGPPVVNNRKDRELSILNNTPATFEIKSNIFPVNLARKGAYGLMQEGFSDLFNNLEQAGKAAFSFESLGKSAVRTHDKKIMKYAQRHDIDPDLTRAVMFAENARGWYGRPMEAIGASESILPMNIQKNRWSTLVGKAADDMYDEDANIEAGTILLKRISDRISKPTPEKIASIWHGLGQENTDDFGEYVGRIYQQKPWRNID